MITWSELDADFKRRISACRIMEHVTTIREDMRGYYAADEIIRLTKYVHDEIQYRADMQRGSRGASLNRNRLVNMHRK